MIFIAYSELAFRSIDMMHRYLKKGRDRVLVHLYQQMRVCDFELLAVTPEPPDFISYARPGDDMAQMELLHRAWMCIRDDKTTINEKEEAWGFVTHLGERIFPQVDKLPLGDGIRIRKWEPGLFRFRGDENKGKYFALLQGDEERGLSTFFIHLLISLWYVDKGFLPFHAAGLLHKDGLFLFSGVSGSGKSTLARLSQKRGCTIVDDDQMLLYRIPDTGWSGDAWRRRPIHADKPLRGIFFIMQSSENRLERLSQTRTARLVLERHYDIFAKVFIEKDYLHALKTSADIAREIPGYELHFRKTADFWDLIDAELGETKGI